MKFRVILTDAAKSDIRAILHWLEPRSPAGAEAWYRKWLEVLDALSDRADALGLAPESDDHPEPIRQILFKTKRGRFYRALFAVREREVFVLHVRGPGQDLVQSQENS
jgi:plasmid stabilization system protein ParE